MTADQSPLSQCKKLESLQQIFKSKFQPTGVESGNTLGMAELYHVPPGSVYSTVLSRNSNMQEKQELLLTFKVISDTAGPNELVATILGRGMMPRISIQQHQPPNQLVCMRAIKPWKKHVTRQLI